MFHVERPDALFHVERRANGDGRSSSRSLAVREIPGAADLVTKHVSRGTNCRFLVGNAASNAYFTKAANAAIDGVEGFVPRETTTEVMVRVEGLATFHVEQVKRETRNQRQPQTSITADDGCFPGDRTSKTTFHVELSGQRMGFSSSRSS